MAYFSGPGEGQLQQPFIQTPLPGEQRSRESGTLSSISVGWVERMFPALIGLFCVSFFCYLLYQQMLPNLTLPSHAVLRCISDLWVALASGIATVGCFSTAWSLYRIHGKSPLVMANRAWLAWLCLGAAAASYTLGQLIWTWYEAKFTAIPFPAIYDPFYLAVYPFSWVGLALLLPNIGSAAGRVRVLLDAGTAVISALTVSWYFILGPTIATLSGPILTKGVALAYPLGDLSLCVVAALLLFSPASNSSLSGMLGRLAIGVTCLAITDSLYGYGQLQGTYHTGLLQDLGWPASWLFICWAALVYPSSLARATGLVLSDDQLKPTRLGALGTALRAITPLILALLTCSLLIIEVALRNSAPLIQVFLVCAGIFLLPVIRQTLTLIDNMMLNERLRVALNQSQQAFQTSQQELLSTSSRAEQYEELRSGIKDLQEVHASLARGDFRVRANVQGPLIQVAMSLNLLIERMNSWERSLQANRIMETEARQVRQALDGLSEGRISNNLPQNWSATQTGGAIMATLRLQNQLASRFGLTRQNIEKLERQSQETGQIFQRVRPVLRDGIKSEQEKHFMQEAFAHLERRVNGNRLVLQDLSKLANVFCLPETFRQTGPVEQRISEEK